MKFLVSFFLALSLFSCHQKPKKPDQHLQQEPELIKISLSTDDVGSLDPRLGSDNYSCYVINMLFEGLTRVGLDGKPQLALAKSYELSPDHKTYLFHLRQSHWSNGDEVTAYDFEYAWKTIVNPQVKSSCIHNFYPIKNVQAVLQGKLPAEEVGIRALDKDTLQVDLEHPAPYFLELIAVPSFYPVNSKLDKSDPNWANQDGPLFISNGPFCLKKWSRRDEILVTKNPHYWDAEKVKLAGIRIFFLPDHTTQLHLFEKGGLDWGGRPFSALPLESIPVLRKEKKLHSVPLLGVSWYFVNTEVFPFTNQKMRKAFAYAINRKEVSDHILQENELPALGILAPGFGVQKEPYFPDGDVEQARALFQEALKELGITKEQLPPLTLSFPNNPIHKSLAQIVQQQWREAFGISLALEYQDWKVYYKKLTLGDFQIGGMGWSAYFSDPIYMLQTFKYRSDKINMSRWEHPLYQQYLDASDEECDLDKRRELFRQAESLLMEEMPVIPLYFTTMGFVKNERLKDVHVSQNNYIDFRWAYLEPPDKVK